MAPATVLSIIIVNWNTKELLGACLRSIYEHTHEVTFEVIVVDNGSEDGSQEMLKKEFPQANLIETGENLGFSKGNNVGLKAARGKYLLLLNSDTKIDTDAFAQMVAWMEAHSQVGICGPKLLNKDGSVQPSGGYLPNLLSIGFNQGLPLHNVPVLNRFLPALKVSYLGFYEQTKSVGWVSGACFMIRREVYEKIGGLDEAIFMYVEEVEMCKRTWDAGWEVWINPDIKVWHLERGSSISGKKGPILGVYKNLYHYFRKHQPSWQLPILEAILKAGALLRWPRAPEIYGEALRMPSE